MLYIFEKCIAIFFNRYFEMSVIYSYVIHKVKFAMIPHPHPHSHCVLCNIHIYDVLLWDQGFAVITYEQYICCLGYLLLEENQCWRRPIGIIVRSNYQFSFMQHMCLCVFIQLTHFSYDDCENTCTWSFYHHQIGSMTHLPLSKVRSWNNGMRCMSFYIPMKSLNVMQYDMHQLWQSWR